MTFNTTCSRVMAAAVAVVTLAASAFTLVVVSLGAPTAHASEPLPTLFPTPTATPTSTEPPASATVSSPDGRLRKGCKRYLMTYEIIAPSEEWVLEVSVVDRTGSGLASFALIGGTEPKAGKDDFRICRWATVPGKFRIRAKLSWYDNVGQETVVRAPVAKFRLRR